MQIIMEGNTEQFPAPIQMLCEAEKKMHITAKQ